MNKLAKVSLGLFLGYLAAWMIAYTIVMGSDFGFVVEYFELGWSFSGGEYPAFIWVGSIVIFVGAILIAASFKVWRRFIRRTPYNSLKSDAAKPRTLG